MISREITGGMFIAFIIMIGIITGIVFFYLTSSQSAILNTISHTELNINGNMTDHRIIANITRDNDSAKLDTIIRLLNNSLTPHSETSIK